MDETQDKNQETTSENKPKRKYTRKGEGKRRYTRKEKGHLPVTEPEPETKPEAAPELKTDRYGMEALFETPPAPAADPHRADLDPKAVTMDIIPSVGPSLSDEAIPLVSNKKAVVMSNLNPGYMNKPKEKKTTGIAMLRPVLMSNLPSRRGR